MLRHVGVWGVLFLVGMAALVGPGAVCANEFYAQGTAKEVAGADNWGKTLVHYLVVLGLPMLSGGLIAGGIMRSRTNVGQGVAGMAGGGAAGWLAAMVKDLHSDAAAAVSLVSLGPGMSWSWWVFGLCLQAATLAILWCFLRGCFTEKRERYVETVPECL